MAVGVVGIAVMIVAEAVVVMLASLALATRIGVVVVERMFPQRGHLVGVTGARLNVVDIGPRDSAALPIVMVHGASSNLGTMRTPLGEALAKTHRVILIDRPGHGWSARPRLADSTPAIQGRMIDEALEKLGIARAVVVAHSWAGALGLRLALDYPRRIAGLVLLAPVANPWRGGVGRYNKLMTLPLIGTLLAYTITLPLGLLLTNSGTRGVFAPQTMPADYVRRAAIPLLLRPREFLANAWDLVTLKAAVIAQAPRYAEIATPTVIVAGDADTTVWTEVHARPLADVLPSARLIVLPGVGHMVQNAATELVAREVELMATDSVTPEPALQ